MVTFIKRDVSDWGEGRVDHRSRPYVWGSSTQVFATVSVTTKNTSHDSPVPYRTVEHIDILLNSCICLVGVESLSRWGRRVNYFHIHCISLGSFIHRRPSLFLVRMCHYGPQAPLILYDMTDGPLRSISSTHPLWYDSRSPMSHL